MARKFSEKDVTVLVGLDAVRKKTAMYIGLTDSTGLYTLVREPGDNVVDEFKAGRAKSVTILLDTKTTQCWVIDDGEGMPVKDHTLVIEGRKVKESTMKSLVSRLHAGGKMAASAAYKNSGGTHGVGIKAVNALSKLFEVHTFRDGRWYYTQYKDSKEKIAVKKYKAPKLPFKTKIKRGTVVSWIPDPAFFSKKSKLEVAAVEKWCELASYLNAGLKVKLVVDGKKPKEFYHKKGVADYLVHELERIKAEAMGKHMVLIDDKLGIDIALAFSDADDSAVLCYTNSIYNKNGGVHRDLVVNAIFKVLKAKAAKKQQFRKEDILEGTVGIINAKMDSPSFSSQDKAELADKRVDEPEFQDPIYKAIAKFFDDNKALARRICEKASAIRGAKAEFHASKKAIAKFNKGKKGKANDGLPAKFSGARCKPQDREVFLVEGDSAAGTARKARDRGFQEILPLRGKILNVVRSKDPINSALASDEVRFILYALGFEPTKKDPLANLRTYKLILLTDADPDGNHIDALINGMLVTIDSRLFEKGIVYAVDSPEYFLEHKKTFYYDRTRKGLLAKIPEGADTKRIKHLKGWGEAPVDLLRQAAFDPQTRVLRQLTLQQASSKKQLKDFKSLMGNDAQYRKELLGLPVLENVDG